MARAWIVHLIVVYVAVLFKAVRGNECGSSVCSSHGSSGSSELLQKKATSLETNGEVLVEHDDVEDENDDVEDDDVKDDEGADEGVEDEHGGAYEGENKRRVEADEGGGEDEDGNADEVEGEEEIEEFEEENMEASLLDANDSVRGSSDQTLSEEVDGLLRAKFETQEQMIGDLRGKLGLEEAMIGELRDELLREKRQHAQRADRTLTPEDLAPVSTEVGKCFDNEDERRKKQAAAKGSFGIFGSLAGAIADAGSVACGGKKGRGSFDGSLLQTNRSSFVVTGLMAMCAGAYAVEGIMGAIDAGVEMGHDLENLGAPNCAKIAAQETLKIVENMSHAVDGLGSAVGDLSDQTAIMETRLSGEITIAMNTLSGRIDEVLAQGERTQSFLREAEGRLDDRMLQIMNSVSTLASKLDNLFLMLLENGERTKMGTYAVLSSSFQGSVAGVSGAFSDFQQTLREMSGHDAKLLKLPATPEAIRKWGADGESLRISVRARLLESWGRARDHFARATATLVDGGLLKLHYSLQTLMKAREWFASNSLNHQCGSFLEDISSFVEYLKEKVFDEDDLISVVESVVIRVVGLHDVVQAAFPSHGASSGTFGWDLVVILERIANAFKDTKDRFSAAPEMDGSTAEVIAEVLAVLLPIECPVNAECLSAAFIEGYSSTEQMVKWDANLVAVNPARLLVDSSNINGVFFSCRGRPLHKQNPAFPDPGHFSPNHGKILSYSGQVKTSAVIGADRQCNQFNQNGSKKRVDINCGSDYNVVGTSERTATKHFWCGIDTRTNEIRDDRIVRYYWYRAENDAKATPDDFRCVLNDGAVTATFGPAVDTPRVDPSMNGYRFVQPADNWDQLAATFTTIMAVATSRSGKGFKTIPRTWLVAADYKADTDTWPNRGYGETVTGVISSGSLKVKTTGNIEALAGTASTVLRYNDSVIIPTTFTICSMTRYAGATKGRILTGGDYPIAGCNWLHGHHQGTPGKVFYGGWMQQNTLPIPTENWVVICGNSRGTVPDNILVNSGNCPPSEPVCGKGRDGSVSKCTEDVTLATNTGEPSDFEIAEIVIWDTELPSADMKEAAHYLYAKLKPFKTLPETWLVAGDYLPSSDTWPNRGRGSDVTRVVSWPNREVLDSGPPLEVKTAGSIEIVAGTYQTKLGFNSQVQIQPTFTICSLTRYATLGRKHRILTSTSDTGCNWLHGHHDGKMGMAHYGAWGTTRTSGLRQEDSWVVMCGTSGLNTPVNILVNADDCAADELVCGKGIRRGNSCPAEVGLAVNTRSTQESDFEIAEIVLWDSVLQIDEMKEAAVYLYGQMTEAYR